jgi:speckle-type POZ protein
MSKMHGKLEKNKGVALKASRKEKKSSSSTSTTVVKEDSDEDSDENMTPEQMALFIRKFNKVIKKGGFLNKNKDKDKVKTKRTSKRLSFGCGKEGHFIEECPNIKVRRSDTNATRMTRTRRRKLVKHTWVKNGTQMMIAPTLMMKWVLPLFLLENQSTNHHSLKISLMMNDFTHTCLMARGSKVDTPTPPLDDDSESDLEFEKMINGFGKKATKRIMSLMKEMENRDGTLEVQEELFRLEREKTIALENALAIEKKGFKVQEDLLKEKELEILSLKKSQAKEALIVDELTRESFLAKDACNKLEGEKLELQKSFES